MVAQLTAEQKRLARHALGLGEGRRKSYRNRYFCGADTAHGKEWVAMVSLGLAGREPDAHSNLTNFYLTRAGAEAALNPRESLCAEDFPSEAR